jgi:hypothetical protein
MPYEIPVPWYLLSSAAAFLGLVYYVRPRIAFRGYVGHHNNIQVLETALILSVGPAQQERTKNTPASRSVEFVIYVTLKTSGR